VLNICSQTTIPALKENMSSFGKVNQVSVLALILNKKSLCPLVKKSMAPHGVSCMGSKKLFSRFFAISHRIPQFFLNDLYTKTQKPTKNIKK
jgi:hypothetical protein